MAATILYTIVLVVFMTVTMTTADDLFWRENSMQERLMQLRDSVIQMKQKMKELDERMAKMPSSMELHLVT